MSLSQIELVWVRVRVEWECFWVNLREDNKVSESKMAVSESNMAEFKMAAIIKLSQNEWVKFFCAKRLKPTWQNSRWLPSSSWVKRNEWIIFLCKWWEPILVSVSEFERKYYDGWIQDGQIQDGRIQDGCQYQFRWEWLSLSQIEFVWVSIRVELECFE